MHAVVVTVEVPEASPEERRRQLEEQVVPDVKGRPGFVAGYWLAPKEGRSTAVIIFDSEQSAQTAAERITPRPGVTILSAEVREVAASATA